MKATVKNLFQQSGITYELDIDKVITGIQFDSRFIEKGHLFIAISGHETDGHCYIEQAISNGAAFVIGERHPEYSLSVPFHKVHNSREALALLSTAYYDFPANRRKVIGITGTNGKTTTAFMLKHILAYNGKSVSMLGTVSYLVNGEEQSASLTTPDALTIQKMIHESRDDYIIMEVSSHGLDQYRVTGSMFDYAIFTNLSHDHLDYHTDMESYYRSKKRLFHYLKENGRAVIGTYNPWGARLLQELSELLIPTFHFGSNEIESSIVLLGYSCNPTTRFTISDHGQEYDIALPLAGKHNIYNALGSYICARDIGLTPAQIIEALEVFPGVPGRFEEIVLSNGAKVIIDYAHTPDGLEHVLNTARGLANENLYHLFGFRGKRDKSKRGEMVRISQSKSDHVFLTLDDLNGIQKDEMIRELYGLKGSHPNVMVVKDRTLAIELALQQLRSDDVLIITGKGQEVYKDEHFHKTITDKETVLKVSQADEVLFRG